MKNRLVLLAVFFAVASWAQAQHGDLYRVTYAKYKHGETQEALDIGFKIFLPAYQMNGINVAVHRHITGPWDAQIVVPIEGEEQIYSLLSPPESVSVSMVELAGGNDQLQDLIEEYNELVVREESSLMVLKSDPLQGEWYLVQQGQEKANINEPFQKKVFQNGQFAFIYAPQENHSWSMIGNYYTHDDQLIETSSYTSNGQNTGITVTWNYQIQDDGILLVEGPEQAYDSEGNDVKQKIFGEANGRLVWQRKVD